MIHPATQPTISTVQPFQAQPKQKTLSRKRFLSKVKRLKTGKALINVHD